MKRGFTIIELLVASLLLGMLVTILTMVFNQSSIAWNIGTAGISGMSIVRNNMAELRDEADNAILWNDQVYRLTGLWDKDGNFRDRACDAPNSQVQNEDSGKFRANFLRKMLSVSSSTKPRDFKPLDVGDTQSAGGGKTYTVNVMSCGPDGKFDTFDDIWSWPDDFE